ncbi:DUF938 domain-containing protein [Sphingorhabdus arenilitoris]|uniref:DUF938 domain-containing protein n=1 Tax=Sphingorhabdus arenilitoris TaxID=1490041 RepID=A0ABV8RHN5_9SPHN
MSGGPRPFVFDESGEAKRFAPATLRNRDAIADILRPILPAKGRVLEIASGTGEHIVHFAALFPALQWQPSDPDPLALASIAAWQLEAALTNIAPALQLDAAAQDWPVVGADAIICINMVHIAPIEAAAGLMRGAGRILPPGAPLYLYGPFIEAAVPLAPSNAEFDQSLKSRDPRWGLRSLEQITALAAEHGLTLDQRTEMPANNLSLIFRRGA